MADGEDGPELEDQPAGSPAKTCKYADGAKGKGKSSSDPIVREELKCFDTEDKGARFYNEKTGHLQIVPKEATDEITITYKGKKIPPFLEVRLNGDLIGTVNGGGVYKYPVRYRPPTSPYASDGAPFWEAMQTSGHPTCIYTFSHADLPRDITVEVFCPDQWKLSIKLPPASKSSLGVKLETSISTEKEAAKPGQGADDEIKSITVEQGVTVTYENKTAFKPNEKLVLSEATEWKVTPHSWTAEDKTTASFESGEEKKKLWDSAGVIGTPPVSLTLNQQALTIDFLQIIGTVLDLISAVEKLIHLVHEYNIKFGWYAELEASFFEGSGEFAWGWREHTDYRAYYYQGLALNVKIFEIGAEFGFGVEARGLEGQICVKLTGELSYALKPFETGKPGKKLHKALKLGEAETKLTPGSYLRLKAGSYANLTGGVEAPVKVVFAGEYSLGKGFSTETEVVAEGVKALIKVTALRFNYNKEFNLFDGATLGKFHWPNQHEGGKKEFKTMASLAELFEEFFESGWWPLQFYDSVTQTTPGILWGENTETTDFDLQTTQVAEMIASRVWRHRKMIHIGRKEMEGLALAIRADLDQIGYRRFRSSRISLAQIEEYLDGADFNTRLTNMQSIAKKYAAAIGCRA